MEDARIRTQRNIPITIGLFLLAIGLFCTLFFLPLQFPTNLYVGLGWGVLYIALLIFTHSLEPGEKSIWLVAVLIAGTGWFAYVGSDDLSRGNKVSGIFNATVGVCFALLAAWEASGLIKMKKRSA